MSFINFLCYFFAIFYFEGVTSLDNDNQQNCALDITKNIPLDGIQNIDIRINTTIKKEITSLRELIKSELKLQKAAIEREKQELDSIWRKSLLEHKNSMEKFIQSETHNFKLFIRHELEAICSKRITEKNEQLLENATKKMSAELKSHEKILENMMKKSIEPYKHYEQQQQHQPISSNKGWDENFNCIENCGPIMDLPDSCEMAMASNFSANGVYLLKLEKSKLKPFFAYCKRIDERIWTIMQRREDGSIDFYRNWTEYKNGFGNLYGEFWLGLERLNALTTQHKHELNVLMEKKNGDKGYAHYKEFLIANETEKYKLTISGYSGNAGDELILSGNAAHNGMKFSTFDNCNDIHSEGKNECALTYRGAWWFNKCYNSHLNGPYNSDTKNGVDWDAFDKKLKYVQMAIRRA